MKNNAILGILLCSIVWLAGCGSDTNAPMPCSGGMLTSSTGTATCVTAPVCTGTMRVCHNDGANGCDTDISNDIKNCGGCAMKCPLPPHGDPVCTDSTCGVTNCETTYKDCNGSADDGCEIDTARDPNNCGSCGNKCAGGANGNAACVAGKCLIVCNAPYLDCNGDPSDGCETNTDADTQNCGSCNNVCPTPANGSAACSAGTCIVSSCTAPFLTCQPGPVNRCETNTSNDVNNCSGCNNVCPNIKNGTPGCLNSACGIKGCNPPYKDCDNMASTGCEDDTSQDVLNCGSCGNSCPAVANGMPGCKSSTCGIGSCNGPFMDCDMMPGNGCEIDTSSNSNNCGSCGNICPSGQVCIASTCQMVYEPVGPQQNIPVATVTGGGWTQCYLDLYDVALQAATVEAACTGGNLMLACRQTGSSTLQLLAWAPRADVLFDTGTSDTPHIANGTEWYFSATYSWGFAGLGEALARGECDTNSGADRLCWHTIITPH